MKKYFYMTIVIVLMHSIVWAKTMYVSDVLKITFRSGPGNNHKILRMLQSGQSVEFLEEEGDWVHVELANGIDGWVLAQFLTPEKTSRLILDDVDKKYENLRAKYSDLEHENKELTQKNTQISVELEALKKKLETTSTAYETLKKNSANFLQLENDYKKATTERDMLTQKANVLEKQNWDSKIKAALVGAGVLFVGIIIGFISKSNRRRSSLL